MAEDAGERAPRRRWKIVAAAIAAVVVVVGVAIGFTALASYKSTSSQPTVVGGVSTPAGAGDADLTVQTAQQIWADYQLARQTQNADLFEQVTCTAFIQADMQQRGLSTVPALLGAYQRAQKFMQVQDIADVAPVSAQGHKPAGTYTVEATVTDNRFVPPQTTRRQVVYAMAFEDDHWTLCPTINPV